MLPRITRYAAVFSARIELRKRKAPFVDISGQFSATIIAIKQDLSLQAALPVLHREEPDAAYNRPR